MALIERYVTAAGGGDGTSFGNAWSFSNAVSNYTAGMRINVVEDTYNLEDDPSLGIIDLTVSATNSAPIVWRGRNATDDGDGRPLLELGNGRFTISGKNIQFMFFDITSNTSETTFNNSLTGDGMFVYRCKFYNTNKTDFPASAFKQLSKSTALDCLFSSLSENTDSYTIGTNKGIISGCKIVTKNKGVKINDSL